MNKCTMQAILTIVIVSIIGVIILLFAENNKATVIVKVCHEIADIEISKCQDYENGCINPKVLINVVSDSPGAKASVTGGSGFYIIRNLHHGPKTIHVEAGETKYETFGCDEE